MLNNVTRYVLRLLILLCWSSQAASFEPDNYKHIDIAVIPNSKVVDLYKGVIIAAYSKIGRIVTLHELAPGRSLLLTNQGELDAELVRVSVIEAKAPNLIRIPVTLAHGKLMLYCALNILCEPSILDNKQNLIGVISGTNITTIYMEQKRAAIYPQASGTDLAKKLKLHQLTYILSIDINGQGNYSGLDKHQFQSVPLLDIRAYHYLNKKYRQLVPALTEALKTALTEKVNQAK